MYPVNAHRQTTLGRYAPVAMYSLLVETYSHIIEL